MRPNPQLLHALEVDWIHELLQRLQEVRTICKTRNQLFRFLGEAFMRMPSSGPLWVAVER
jgi:hypothetical protein